MILSSESKQTVWPKGFASLFAELGVRRLTLEDVSGGILKEAACNLRTGSYARGSNLRIYFE